MPGQQRRGGLPNHREHHLTEGVAEMIVKATLQQPRLTCTSLRRPGVAEALYETGVSPEGLSAGYATVLGYE